MGTTGKSFKLSTDILVARIGVLARHLCRGSIISPDIRIVHTLSSSYIDLVTLSQTYGKVIRSRVTCYFYAPTIV